MVLLLPITDETEVGLYISELELRVWYGSSTNLFYQSVQIHKHTQVQNNNTNMKADWQGSGERGFTKQSCLISSSPESYQ